MASSEYTRCLAYLNQGAALVAATFIAWFGVRKEGEWLKEKDADYGDTLLHVALTNKVPEAVANALFAAWADAVKEKNIDDNTPLHIALWNKDVPETIIQAFISQWSVTRLPHPAQHFI